MPSAVEEFEVVVAGAGPGGLASAVTLGSHGVETLVVDRRRSTSHLPRATVASTGTMELLRRWGLEEQAWERSQDVEWQAWSTPTMADADRGEPIDVGYPTRREAALVSPTAPACIPQDELEPILERHLGRLQSVHLERGVELLRLEPGDGGGHVLTLTGPGGRQRRVRARYVVGADGIRSRVREELEIATRGADGLAEGLAILFRGPIWELVGERRYGIYFITEPEGRSFIPVGAPDRWQFGIHLDSGAEDADAITPERASRWIRDAAGDSRLPVEIERWMPVTFGIALADRFRAGDAFLIGDAAHRVTPRGGTGLNTAIRDGYDVGWKLAWVVRGWAAEDLLDSYERERRPVAEFNARRSMRDDGSILNVAAGVSNDIGGRIPHVWVPRGSGLVSTLDLLGEGHTLFAGPDWQGRVPDRAGAEPPLNIERLDAVSARALGLTAAGSLLARTDGQQIALSNGSLTDRRVGSDWIRASHERIMARLH